MDNFTRCPDCLALAFDGTTCHKHTPKDREERAIRLLHYKGYMISKGQLLLVQNDDPDNWQDRLLGSIRGDAFDTYQALEASGWPQVAGEFLCIECGAFTEQIGGLCLSCDRVMSGL